MSASRPYLDCDFEEARLLQRKLSDVFSVKPYSASVEESLQAVQRLCDRALLALADDYCQERLCEIERQAGKFFLGGLLPFRRRLIFDALEAINDRVSGLEAQYRAEDVVADADAALQKH